MKKITVPQLIFLLFFTRGFLSITYETSQFRPDGLTVMLAAAVSVGIQTALIIPVIIVAKKYPDRDILQVLFQKSRTAGILLSLVYLGYFAFETVHVMGDFSYFLKNYFFKYYNEAVLIIALALAALHSSTLGFGATARASTISAAVFIFTLLVIVFAVTGEFDIYNLQHVYPDDDNTFRNLLREVYDSLGRSVEMTALVFLLPHVKSNKAGSSYGYLTVKLVFTELSALVVTAVLGNYARGLSMPFYTLSTYARTSVVERFDSIYMLVWTIAVFLKVVVLFYLGGICLKNVFPKLGQKTANAVAAAATAIPASALAVMNRWNSLFFRSPSGFATIILGSAIPLAVCLLRNRKKQAV